MLNGQAKVPGKQDWKKQRPLSRLYLQMVSTVPTKRAPLNGEERSALMRVYCEQ